MKETEEQLWARLKRVLELLRVSQPITGDDEARREWHRDVVDVFREQLNAEAERLK